MGKATGIAHQNASSVVREALSLKMEIFENT